MVAVGKVRSSRSLVILWGQCQYDLLVVWIWGMNKRRNQKWPHKFRPDQCNYGIAFKEKGKVLWQSKFGWYDWQFNFGYSNFEVSIRQLSEAIERIIKYTRLEFRREMWAGDTYTHTRTSTWTYVHMYFIAMTLREITKDGIHREETLRFFYIKRWGEGKEQSKEVEKKLPMMLEENQGKMSWMRSEMSTLRKSKLLNPSDVLWEVTGDED